MNFNLEEAMQDEKLTYGQCVGELAMSYKAMQFPDFLSFVLAAISAPVVRGEAKKIARMESEKDLKGLLLFIYAHGYYRGRMWEKACQAIGHIGAAALPALAEAMDPKSNLDFKVPLTKIVRKQASTPHLRYSAAYCLELIGDESGIKILEVALGDPDAGVRAKAKDALAAIRDKNKKAAAK
jgi:hypothetical protein